MKNIFLDCGTHLCEGLIDFYNKKIIDDSFEIHTFEANPACLVEERCKKIPLNITVHNKAVWIEDGYIKFNQENHKKSRSGSPTDGKSDIDGWGSSIDDIGFDHPGYDSRVIVESIDFSRFVNSLPEGSNIICKMDIEGSEFEVLRKMLKDGSIKNRVVWRSLPSCETTAPTGASQYSADIEAELTRMLSEELAKQIDKEILTSLGLKERNIRRINKINKIFKSSV
jgi:FkbM family methyltransferase